MHEFFDIPAGEKKINDNYFHIEQALSILPEKDFSRSYQKYKYKHFGR